MALGGILIDDEQIEAAFKGTNFGPCMETVEAKKKEVAKAVLKKVCNFATGSTISHIMHELGLTKTLHGQPTKAGRRWMYDVLGRGI